MVSTDVAGGPLVQPQAGALSVDINEDHLAVAETDGSGNLVAIHRLNLVLYGCSSEQAKARIGDAIKQLIALALLAQKPIVVEDLDFTKKKREMKASGVKYARMLSSFAYARILTTLKARAFDAGLQVLDVNPAFSSVIGKYKFANRYGLSIHDSAALVLARRAFSFTERPNPIVDHGTSRVPARKRGEHVWSYWGKVLREERRLQRTVGRLKPKGGTAIPTPRTAGGTKSGPTGLGGIPGREQAPGQPSG
jgi:IS605 OrfB family transposase